MNINEFSKGDLITLTTPSDLGNRSFIGHCLVFNEIKNSSIYLTTTDKELAFLWPEREITLRLVDYAEGWEKWESPEELVVTIPLSEYLGMEQIVDQYLKQWEEE